MPTPAGQHLTWASWVERVSQWQIVRRLLRGTGLARTGAPPEASGNRIHNRSLEQKLNTAEFYLTLYKILDVVGVIMGLALLPVAISSYLETRDVLASQWAIVGLFGFSFPVLFPISYQQELVQAIQNEIDLRVDENEKLPQRATRLFLVHQNELKRYYDQILHQGAWIFVAGIALIALGFGIIIVTLSLIAASPPGTDLTKQVVTGVIGGAGTFATDFVAAVYLQMYKGTADAVKDFHTKLVATHDLHYAHLLAAQIEPETAAQAVIGKIALAIAKVPESSPSEDGKSQESGEAAADQGSKPK